MGDERGNSQEGIEDGFVIAPQLYDLANDPGGQTSLADRYAAMVAGLHAEAMRIAADTYR